MHLDSVFFDMMVYLLAAVVSVPIAKKIGLGSVLGYLIAGIVIGPFALGLVGVEDADVMHFAEFGVVIMLFLIGLELHPNMLWRMKRLIFGLGGLQIGITAGIIVLISSLFWLNLAQAITTGLILALSSTAIVLQTLTEKGLLQTRGGRHSFSVLLMQDIAVVPIFAILALLANQVVTDAGTETVELAGEGWMNLLLIIGAVGVIVIGGRYVAHYIFRYIAETGLRELFTATALLMVIGIAVAMDAVGLSPALGTFLAGVVLANSEYRYELENNLEPSKGLLLGLFFISVGASINFTLLMDHAVLIFGILILLIIIKFTVLIVLGRIFKLKTSQNLLFTFSLSQAGEFGFVLVAFASQNAIYDEFTSGVLLIVIALSMLITPLLFIINEKIILPRISKKEAKEIEQESIEDEGNPVIIAGFGRFGMVLGRFLNANGVKSTIIDINPHNIEYLKKFGYKIYYGDITRADMLEAAGAKKAKVLVIVMGDRQQIDKLIEVASKNFPHLKLVVRAVDVAHSLELANKKVDYYQQETFDSAVSLGADALRGLGQSNYSVHRAATTFKHLDRKFMDNLRKRYGMDDPHFVMETKKFSEHIENILLLQQKHPYNEMDCAWDTSSMIEEEQKKNRNK
ncbi:monovalent cation:proton antiporter-2 (CPA2) family protein [Carboxylicivirga linearis]|uniref:Monovalent cation:proton antiporter-2 (CPA2) family protein n=1 Tax=Carboxylicivirga linearis TaxID=1628157 RepID=A0ABS5JUA4_9BACT|nr:monovalent cation:proton antiporter-2 (CPA2) family protein [Carboxylicivirga linearis]MBS2098489.1 monovalent cation:proton antiporter-2 (CPA2) family protein [Carboxylicivirga linearis]